MSTPIFENGNNFNPFAPNASTQDELGLSDLLGILNKGKFILIGSFLIFAALAAVASLLLPSKYEATLVLKKEATDGQGQGQDEFNRIVAMQTGEDQIETEAELVKSRVVLEGVIEELSMFIHLDEIIVPDVISHTFNQSLAEYQYDLSQYPNTSAPRVKVLEFNAAPGFREAEGKQYLLEITESGTAELFDMDEEVLIDTSPNAKSSTFTLPLFQLGIEWPDPKPGSQLHFSTLNIEELVTHLSRSIDVSTPLNTSLLRVSTESTSPYLAKLISNTVGEQFRESRIEHKRETIRYSSSFIDTQLEEIAGQLQGAEQKLGAFRGERQITDIDESTRQLIDFMANLENEKIQTELELTEYRSRYSELSNQLSEKGFFDQTYLTPTDNSSNSLSPFSTLLERLNSAELERLELLQKRTSTHPDVIAVDDRITEIRRNLSEYNENTISSYQILIRSLERKLSDLNSLIASYRGRVRNLADSEAELMELTRNREMYQKMYILLSDKREEMRLAELSRMQDIVVVETATLPYEAIGPKKKLNTVIGGILGLLFGLTLVFYREFNGKTITSPKEIEESLSIPILAMMPNYPANLREKIKRDYNIQNHIELLTDTRYGFKESYRMLRTKLTYILSTKRSPTKNNILFTSCEENTGKTTIVTNFSLMLALAGKRIMVIDCDLKNPSVGRFFGIPFNAPGLIDFLSHDYVTIPDIYNPLEEPIFEDMRLFNPTIQMQNEEMRMVTRKLHLDVIPAGGSVEHSSELLDSEKFRDYLLEISDNYDYVLIDTPPVTKTVDGLTLGTFIKNAIVVVKPDYTRKESLNRAIMDFRQFNVHLLGSVVNGCDIQQFASSYGYAYGYTYEYKPKYLELPEKAATPTS